MNDSMVISSATLTCPLMDERGMTPTTANASVGMRLAVIGLGYVGLVTAACFSRLNHRVVGVDSDPVKLAAIERLRSPIVESNLAELIKAGVQSQLLSVRADIETAMRDSDVTLICVGTPSASDGKPDLAALRTVAVSVGRALAKRGAYHVVVVRSTVPAGTIRGMILPILERESGLRHGHDFGLCHNPEFLREGTAIDDFFEPPKTVIGAIDERSARVLATMYADVGGPIIHTTLEAAEMVKCVDNAWHAVKVSFANEMGRLCHGAGAPAKEVMKIFIQDKKLNLSSYYLRPGFAFGGSCLPKDVRALCASAKDLGIPLPLLDSILPSNDRTISRALDLIRMSEGKRIGILGVTFKAGTDDLRESPQVDLLGRLLATDVEVRVHDHNITSAGLELAKHHARLATGGTKLALQVLGSLRTDTTEELIQWADVVILAHNSREYSQALHDHARTKQIVDLVGMEEIPVAKSYVGICW